MNTLVLRYRDFDADTVAKHRSVLRDRGEVWWGWWRKEHEPLRLNELSRLADRLKSSDAPLVVGMFDRSERRFFRAMVDALVASDEPRPSPDPDATPDYYRSDPFEVWFRLVGTIDELDPGLFRDEFGEIPSGDWTLFPVEGDKGRRTPLEPDLQVRSDEIPMPGEDILHLSDLHFGSDFGFDIGANQTADPLERIISRDLHQQGANVGLLVLSGDLTTRGDAGQLFNAVIPFLKDRLLPLLSLEPEHVVIVPGNHDLPVGEFQKDYGHERAFRAFIERFSGSHDSQLHGLERFRTPAGRRLAVLRMHSVRLRSSSKKNFGFLDWNLYDELLTDAGDFPADLRMAVLHHHLVPAPETELLDDDTPEASVSITLDAGKVVQGLQGHGFELAMHGHQHVPGLSSVARARPSSDVGEVMGLDQPLFVAAAGSAGVSASRLADAMRDNAYTLLRPGDGGWNWSVRSFNPRRSPSLLFRSTLPIGLSGAA